MCKVELIYEFSSLADSLGHCVPDISKWLYPISEFVKQYIHRLYDQGNADIWTHPVVALAQHHRIPTRLLDWTRHPLVAAYFAAVDVAKNTDVPKRIAVYAIHEDILKYHLRIVNVPRSDNRYLQAQHGLFIYDDKGDELFLKHGKYPSIEESVTYIPEMISERLKPQKLTLPASEAPDLLRLLWLERITQAHLLPTLDNVSEALKTKWYLINEISRIGY